MFCEHEAIQKLFFFLNIWTFEQKYMFYKKKISINKK